MGPPNPVDAPGAIATVEPPPAPTEMAMSVEEYCAREAELDQAWCDYRDRCCTAEDQASDVFFLPACNDQALAVTSCVSTIQYDVEDGLVFDGRWAEACLDALEPYGMDPPADCSGLLRDRDDESNHTDPLRWQLEACRLMLTSNLAEGQLCNNFRACAPGLACGSAASSDGESTCVPTGGVGTPCRTLNECDLGLTCDGDFDVGNCSDPKPVGGPCVVADNCQEGLICHLDYCAPTLDVGESCPDFFFCRAHLTCDFSSATCASLLAPGGACDSDYDCDGRCDTATGTCVTVCGGTR